MIGEGIWIHLQAPCLDYLGVRLVVNRRNMPAFGSLTLE